MTVAPTLVRAEVVIAVHTVDRPLRRAVLSVLDDDDRVGVIVVAHNLRAAALADHLAGCDPARVRVLECHDGLPRPAGPFNLGIAAVQSEFFALMGSDDFWEPGAVLALLAHADVSASRGAPADVVMAPLRRQDGADILTPLPRPGRERALDAVRDRLFYRTAPLGLLRTATWRDGGYRLDESVRTGEDVDVTARLWTIPSHVTYARHAPRYVIGADAAERVTTSPMSVREAVAPVWGTAKREWARCASPAVRRSLATKFARIHVLGFVAARRDVSLWSDEDLAAAAEALSAISTLSPKWFSVFARADRNVFDALVDPRATAESVVRVLEARAAAGLWSRNIPRVPWLVFDRESNLTRFVLYMLDRRSVQGRKGGS